MNKIIKIVFLLSTPIIAFSQEEDYLQEYLWKNRILLIFTKSEQDIDYQEQMKLMNLSQKGLSERNLIVFSIFDKQGKTSTNKEVSTYLCKKLRQKFEVDKDIFTVILIGKDGGEKYRSKAVITDKQLFAIIDAMPMRKAEMKH
ncbi:MAG: DUF4174 domain-containing protein [Thermoflexibacter sp.]|jgi:hypothetical protein|nr:DUF4174 domain-containing protein [Thermoflexibacter sp.]